MKVVQPGTFQFQLGPHGGPIDATCKNGMFDMRCFCEAMQGDTGSTLLWTSWSQQCFEVEPITALPIGFSCTTFAFLMSAATDCTCSVQVFQPVCGALSGTLVGSLGR
mmetsp:Transcript_105132/g.338990  ORF Transcript_105132/g.338990 Transcript_105132/m.338990 type:complete len:108 (+) Transcript_105132:435-758(+)